MIPDDIALQHSRQRGTSDEWKVSEVTEFLQKEILSSERTMHLIKPGNSRDSQSYQKPLKDKTHRKHNVNTCSTQNRTVSRNWYCCMKRQTDEDGTMLCVPWPKNIARFCKTKMCCTVCGSWHSSICNKGEKHTSDGDDKFNVVSFFASYSLKIQPAKQNNTVLMWTLKSVGRSTWWTQKHSLLIGWRQQKLHQWEHSKSFKVTYDQERNSHSTYLRLFSTSNSEVLYSEDNSAEHLDEGAEHFNRSTRDTLKPDLYLCVEHTP